MAGQRDAAKSGQSSGMCRIIITTLVSSLAAGLGACSTTNHAADRSDFGHTAGQASVQIAPDATSGRYDSNYYAEQARSVNAPGEWVQEANAQSALLSLRRAEAEGARVEAAADRASSLAQADQMLAEAAALHQIAGFEAVRQRTAQKVRFNQLEEEIRAHQALSEIAERGGQVEISAVASDLKGQVAMMTAEADAAWAGAKNQCESLRAEHDRVSEQGQAIIDQMNEQMRLLGERADHQASSLVAQSEATRQRAQAEAQLLAQQARSHMSAGTDRQTELNEQAERVVREAEVEARRLAAEASAIESSNIEGTFRSAMARADQSLERSKADADGLRQTAMQRLGAFTAEYTRARQEAEYRFASDQAAHDQALTALEAEGRQASAAYSIAMSRAQESEFDAREAFIRAEMGCDTSGVSTAESRAGAEQSADALATAFRETASGDPAAADILSNSAHGDAWVRSVAECDRTRAGARNSLDRSNESIGVGRVQAEMAFEDAHATYRNTKGGIAASEHGAAVEVEQMFARADAMIGQAERDCEQARVNAGSVRDQAIARAQELRVRAQTVMAGAESESKRLRIDGEAAFATAQAMATEFEQKREAVLAGGEAQSQQFQAQAELVRSEKSRRVADLTDRIGASESLLNAETERLKTVAQQTLEVAILDHEEAMLLASTFERIGTARIEALVTHNVLGAESRVNALARTEQDVQAEHKLVNARIDTGMEQAHAAMDTFETEDSLRRARAGALEQIMLAYVEQRHATAEAEESAVASRFNARLAQLQADRDRAYARAYMDRQRALTEQAVADAPALPALSDATLARLESVASSIREAAAEARNILRAAQMHSNAQSGADALEFTNPSAGEVANVPTDSD